MDKKLIPQTRTDFPDGILGKRPEDMSYEEYRRIRKNQTEHIKRTLRRGGKNNSFRGFDHRSHTQVSSKRPINNRKRTSGRYFRIQEVFPQVQEGKPWEEQHIVIQLAHKNGLPYIPAIKRVVHCAFPNRNAF